MGYLFHAFTLALLLLYSYSVGAQIVINEFLPDPAGPDSGHEFVELYNAGSAAINLEGLALQFANGAEEPHWLERWVCDNSQYLEPGQYYLICDRNWQGSVSADAEVYLGLQNGPDAIRIVHDTEVLDLVGYGLLTDATMFEGEAVPVVTGYSLARRPDGNDTHNNALDFVQAEASPGGHNFLPYELRLLAFNAEPPSAMGSDELVTFEITLENNGTEDIATSHVSLIIGNLVMTGVLDANGPGQQRSLLFRGTTGLTGKLPVYLQVPIPTPQEYLDVFLGYYQIGPGPVVINEILGAPDRGQGEWVEFLFVGSDEDNLNEYRIRDEGGSWINLPSLIGLMGEVVVVAQDSVALVQWQEDVILGGGIINCGNSIHVPGPILALPQWPSLNNSAPDGRDFADRLYLCDADGCVVDHVTMGWEVPGLELDIPAGHSLERRDINGRAGGSLWAPSLSQIGSTPGCANSVEAVEFIGSGLSLDPQVLDAELGTVVINIGFEIMPPAMGYDIRMFDLGGQLVRDLGGEQNGPGPRQLLWDGRDDSGRWPPSGAYIVLLRVRSNDGGILVREKKLAVLRRPE